MGLIKALVLHGPEDLRIEERSLAPPPRDHVQVEVHATGLCGSDLHYYSEFRNGDIQVKEPLILGHESVGVVVAVGSNVTQLREGDKVALEVGISCESCESCKEGRYNLCKDMKFGSSARKVPHTQGTLQQRLNHPARLCHRIPDGMPLALAVLIEPLSVVLHALRRASLSSHAKRALVFGAGTIGLLSALVLKHAGVDHVVMADINPARLHLIDSDNLLDGTYTMPLTSGSTRQETEDVAKTTAADLCVFGMPDACALQFDVIFECTGAALPLQTAVYAAKPGTRIMLVGMGTPWIDVPLMAASSKEVDLVGVFRYANTYKDAIDMLWSSETGDNLGLYRFPVHHLVGFEKAEEAFKLARSGRDNDGVVLKVAIVNEQATEHWDMSCFDKRSEQSAVQHTS